MQLPLTEPATLCEELWQDLPPEASQLAREFTALVRARQVTTPALLLRVVFFYCGLATSWREVAGTLTALYEALTDHAVAARLRACGPWGPARLRQMLSPASVGALPTGRRVVVIDASRMQAPGATGTEPRLPSALARLALPLLAVLVSDVPPGATRQHCPLAPGAGAGADRGSAQCPGRQAAVAQGADRLGRRHPSVILRDAARAPVALCVTVHRQQTAPLRTLAVPLGAAGGQHAVQGWGHASRLHEEHAQRARPQGRQGHKKGTPSAESLLLAGGVLVLTTLAPAGLTVQTIMALSRGRWQGESARQRWKSGLDMDALRAKATSPRAEGWLHGTVR